MAVVEVCCPDCDSLNIVKYGKQPNGAQRFVCQNPKCKRRIFLINYKVRPQNPEARQQIIELALGGVGVDETADLLSIPKETVMEVFQLLSSFSLPANNPKKRPAAQHRTLDQALAG